MIRLKIFYGRESPIQTQDWHNALETLANLNSWLDKYRLQFTRGKLTGAGLSWFSGAKFMTWQDFKTDFEKAFVGTTTKLDCWENMTARVQAKSEHMAEYIYDKLRLCTALDLSFEYIIRGIVSKELAINLLGRTHQDKHALFNDFREYKRLIS